MAQYRFIRHDDLGLIFWRHAFQTLGNLLSQDLFNKVAITFLERFTHAQDSDAGRPPKLPWFSDSQSHLSLQTTSGARYAPR